MLLGFALLTVARVNLGDAFSVRPEATKLVMRGLYSRIRNPIYVFGTLTIAGIILYIDKAAFLTLLLPVVALQMWRARAEGHVLESKFGEEYRRYRARTWF
jgi:protein-S-isoprenylcysteine O-methyltransferase Ste14